MKTTGFPSEILPDLSRDPTARRQILMMLLQQRDRKKSSARECLDDIEVIKNPLALLNSRFQAQLQRHVIQERALN